MYLFGLVGRPPVFDFSSSALADRSSSAAAPASQIPAVAKQESGQLAATSSKQGGHRVDAPFFATMKKTGKDATEDDAISTAAPADSKPPPTDSHPTTSLVTAPVVASFSSSKQGRLATILEDAATDEHNARDFSIAPDVDRTNGVYLLSLIHI